MTDMSTAAEITTRTVGVGGSNRFPRFGEKIAFAEPAWYQGAPTPYYKETHVKFREKVRDFVEKEIKPYVSQWEEEEKYPQELHRKCYEAGLYGATFPAEYGGTPPPDYDAFHELILFDEIARSGAGGVVAGLILVPAISIPPIIRFGSKELKDRVLRDLITARKFSCLAVTEPFAGSDVANIQTTAVRDGDYYIVNGQKKFISGGHWANYFVTAVRTGGEGMSGVSVLLIERDTPGITVRRLKTQGWYTSHTTHILFEDVRVPVGNLLGQENEGFRIIMSNFNHERLIGCVMANRASREAYAESVKYSKIRKTFGKPLIAHQVIRAKLAEMIRLIESTHALLEHVTYQITQGNESMQVASTIALLKVHTTKVMEFCAREASQIFGGASYLRSGPGERVERLYREVRVAAIGGGSEEIMMELGVKLARL